MGVTALFPLSTAFLGTTTELQDSPAIIHECCHRLLYKARFNEKAKTWHTFSTANQAASLTENDLLAQATLIAMSAKELGLIDTHSITNALETPDGAINLVAKLRKKTKDTTLSQEEEMALYM